MIRRVLSFIVVACIISSCNNTGKKNVTSTGTTDQAAKVEFAALVANPENYVGKNIIVEGKVVHVCTETGKKLFIVGENPDIRLFISAGENMPKFSMDLLGSTVVVEGLIKKSGSATGEPAMKPDMGSDTCKTESSLIAQADLADIVMEYKSHTVSSKN